MLAVAARTPDHGKIAPWRFVIVPDERRDAFAALYLAFLGRINGPRAGWLLASLDRAFVIQRLRDAAGDVPVRTPSELAEQDSDQ